MDWRTEQVESSVIGPFRNGSVGCLALEVTEDGRIYLAASYERDVSFWREKEKRIALKAIQGRVRRWFKNVDLGQGLFVFDEQGHLQHAEHFADGYLYEPIRPTVLPQGSVGFYAKSSSTEFFTLEKKGKLFVRREDPPRFVFLEIPLP